MPNESTPLWPKSDANKHFTKKEVHHISQGQWEDFDSSCVPTCLAMLARMASNEGKDDRDWVKEFGEEAEGRKVNTQNPVEWSEALRPYGMKLAYLPTDVRPLGLYLDDLIRYDDLFMLGFYTGTTDQILAATVKDAIRLTEENEQTFQAGPSHVVLLHKGQIYDPAMKKGSPMEAKAWLKRKLTKNPYKRRKANFHTKRLFRVLPLNERGL